MSDDTNIFGDPGWWAAIALALTPILIAGFVIWWVQQ